jgi:hypothetical protein
MPKVSYPPLAPNLDAECQLGPIEAAKLRVPQRHSKGRCSNSREVSISPILEARLNEEATAVVIRLKRDMTRSEVARCTTGLAPCPATGLCSSSGCVWQWPMTPANEAARRSAQARRQTADHALTIYDGQRRVSPLVERDGRFLTYDIGDLPAAAFATLRDAMRALPVSRSSS